MSITLNHEQLITFFASLAVLIALARVFGEWMHYYDQPAVLGEILAGILLGPTVLGSLAPQWSLFLFPANDANTLVLNSISYLSVVLFMLVAGLEVDLSTILRLGRQALVIGILSLIAPMAIGFTVGWFVPQWVGAEEGANHLVFALFFGTALSICALPVIAKTLIDLNIFKTDLGMMIISVAIFHDLTGWLIFAVILSLMRFGETNLQSVGMTLTITFGFVALILSVGRNIVNRVLPWVQAYTQWPGGVLGLVFALGLTGAAFTEWLGIHGIFGAFLVGVAVGDSKHLRQHTRRTLEQFVGFIFAPIFFASIGLKVNFITHFDLPLTLIVITIACFAQVLGGTFAARLVGFRRRESWSIGFALNARGAMEIILGLLALETGLIGQRLFVSLVIMALFTSLASGPILRKLLQLQRGKRFTDFVSQSAFVGNFSAKDRFDAIEQLSMVASQITKLPAKDIADRVRQREEMMPTGLAHWVAIPHARIEGLAKPTVVIGVSQRGIDFDAPDGEPSKVIVCVLTSEKDSRTQLEILADIGKTFEDKEKVESASRTTSLTEFRAVLNVS